jgi:ABC-type antimicrobial peptide transport system permease subunit
VKGSLKVVVISQGMARLYWQDKDPVGQCLMVGDDKGCTTIVGVAQDARRNQIIEEPAVTIYLPMAQWTGKLYHLLLFVHSRGDANQLAAALRPVAQGAWPGLPFVQTQAMRDEIADQYATWRLGATLFGAFGLLGLVLAAIGVYGALAYRVKGRTRELGIRLALGAEARNLALMVLQEGLLLALAGITIGVMGALAAGKTLQALLYGISPSDPMVLLATVLVLLVAAVLACWFPARRATRVDPMVALRSE